MRTIFTVLVVLAVSVPAFADEPNIAGVYDVKFEESGSTCNPPPVALGRGKLTIEVKKGVVTVNTDLIPLMTGTVQKSKVAVKTTKIVGTTVQGLSAKYSAAGRVDGGMLQLVMTAEYVRQDTGKPYCTQAWNVSGLRGDAKDK